MEKMSNEQLRQVIAELERTLEQQPQSAAALFPQAIHAYRRLIAVEPANVGATVRLAALLHGSGKTEEGLGLVRELARRYPDSPQGWLALGTLLFHQEQLPEAKSAIEKVIRLAPEAANAQLLLGKIYNASQQFPAAIDAFEKAVALDPRLLEAHRELATHYQSARRFDKAYQHYESILEIAPGWAEIRLMLAACLFGQGYQAESRRQFQRVLQTDPDNTMARIGVCMSTIPAVYGSTEEIAVTRAAYEQELNGVADFLEGEQAQRRPELVNAIAFMLPFYLPYQGRNDKTLQARYGKMVHGVMAHCYPQWNLPPGKPAARQRREPVRLTILSSHICTQSVWNAITRGWLETLDRELFSISIVSTSRYQDRETTWAKDHCERFVQSASNFDEICQAVRDGSPDVVLFPEVGLDPLTVQLAALRHAPVQCVSWGHPETTGLPTIDYFLSAELLEPADGEQHYSEKLVRLPGLGCNPSSALPFGEMQRREDSGIDPSRPAFLCSQTPYKYLPEFDLAIIRIAQRLPRAFFLFSRHGKGEGVIEGLEGRLRESFQDAGLDYDYHCRFMDRLPLADFHALSRQMDVYLDTTPFSGFNTAMGALGCGLPVVTREGDYLRGRFASAVLRRIGVTETIARDMDHYVELAVSLIEDTNWRDELCRRVEQRLPEIFDDPEPARELTRFLRSL